jgi:hypothetical protein
MVHEHENGIVDVFYGQRKLASFRINYNDDEVIYEEKIKQAA